MAPWMSPGYWSPNMRSLEEQLQQELEGHRKTWRQLEHVTGLLLEIVSHSQTEMNNRLRTRALTALSQQAEPVELAPAQDERTGYACHQCRTETPPPDPYKLYVVCQACGASTAATAAQALAHIAQTEQQPEVRQIKKPSFGLPYGTSGKEVP